MQRVRVTWTGFPGAPGVTTFYCSNSWATQLADIRTFFEALKPQIPVNVTITYPSSGDDVDPVTGDIIGSWAQTAPAPTVGTSAVVYAAPVGLVAHWNTNGIVAGRRVRGRTFVVPMVSNSSTDGTPSAAQVLVVVNAAAALAAHSPGLVVWRRPNPLSSVTAGSEHPVVSSTVPDKYVVLRSRRD